MKKEEKVLKALNEVENSYNYCWAYEIDRRNKNNLDFPALYYRGKNISYKDFMNISNNMAKSLKEMGYEKNNEILVCMSNCPELVMLMRATSLIGAKFHVFSEEFATDYIEQIIEKSETNTIFISDDKYAKLKNIISKFPKLQTVMMSLADSLPHGEDPYWFLDQGYYDFKNLVPMYKNTENRVILSKQEFLNLGKNTKLVRNNTTKLDDEFLITYTSGSTNGNRPSAIVHTNRSLICMGRFHDADISGLPETKYIKVLCHIPPHSNTDLITSISDALMQRSTAALEPIYNEYFFLNSLIINKVNFAPATRCFWIRACKIYNSNPLYKNIKFPELFLPTIVGEPKSPGEEKYINSTLKKMSAGTKKLPRPIGPAVISFGGGDCEHGGLFFTLFPSLFEKINKIKYKNQTIGLKPFNSAIELACLDENGKRLKPGELGFLAANSPLTMKCYKDEPLKTENFYITDNFGKKWGNMNVYGYIDNLGYAHMLGRNNSIKLGNTKIPLFKINNEILKDSKNILSSEVVITDGILVAHIETFPGKNISSEKIIKSIVGRLLSAFPQELLEQILFKVRSNIDSFPITGCGKRNSIALINEGLTDDLIKANIENDEITLTNLFNGKSRNLHI